MPAPSPSAVSGSLTSIVARRAAIGSAGECSCDERLQRRQFAVLLDHAACRTAAEHDA